MEESNKFCKNCMKYNAFYVKRLLSFEKQTKGLCSKKEKVVEQSSVCKSWCKDYNFKRMKKAISTKMVCKMAEDLNTICQILTEEFEQN